jgi:hypothetical protein
MLKFEPRNKKDDKMTSVGPLRPILPLNNRKQFKPAIEDPPGNLSFFPERFVIVLVLFSKKILIIVRDLKG